MEETLDSASKIISEWQSNDAASDYCPNTSLFDHHSRGEFLQFIRAVKDLQSSLLFLSSTDSSSKKLSSAHNLLRSAIKRLSREFSALLKAKKPDHLYPPVDPSDSDNDGGGGIVSTVDDLKLIADCMLSAGYGKKCVKIYKLTRRSVVEDAVSKLGARKLKKSQVQKMDWEAVESRIKEWSTGVRTAVKQIFLGEKILCDHLFSSSYSVPPVKDSCFAEVCKESALALVRVPGKFAKHSKKSPEKLFRYLDLYEPLAELSPDIDLIFSSDLTAIVRSQTESSLIRTTDVVRSTLSDFEALMQKDAMKTPVPGGGGVHPLTRYVMNYFSSLVNYTSALDKILADCPISLQLPESYFEGETTSSPAALRFTWLILVLLCRLDAKSELYKDASLSYLFLANNLQYVVTKVTGSKLRNVLGEKWVAKHSAKVVQYAANHERMGWGRVISDLPEDPTVEIPLDKVKECFRKFNADFAEEYRKQVDWVVLDTKLRDEMKASVARRVGRRYRGMYEKYNQVLSKSRDRGAIEAVIKFTPEDLENFLSELLDGPDSESNDDAVWAPGDEAPTAGPEAVGVLRRRKRLLLLIRQHLHHP